MKRFITALLLASGICSLGYSTENVLENADFTHKTNARFTKWVPLNGTTLKQDDKGIVLQNLKNTGVTLIQHIRPRPDRIVNLSVEVMCLENDQARTYIEHSFTGKDGKMATASSGAIWENVPAGKWVTLKSDIILQNNYKHCYFVVGNKSGKTMYIRNPKVEVMYDSVLRNPDFSIKRHGKISNWDTRGKGAKQVVFGADGTVKVADAFIIQTYLRVESEQTYELSYEVRGEAGSQYRAYIEWHHQVDGKRKFGTRSTGWKPAAAEWTKGTLTVKTSPDLTFAYAVFGAKDAKAVEFRNLQVKLVEEE